jgi:cell division protein FtsI (penicillin-binding protein 3)
MKKKNQHVLRFYAVCLFFAAIFVTLLWRMVVLTVLDRPFLQGQGNARSIRVIDIPAYRGMILDRNGDSIAVSTPVQSLWVNPKLFHPDPYQLKKLAHLLNMPAKQISSYVQSVNKRGFVYLKRQLPPSEAQKIEKLHIPGLNFQQEFKRYYPDADSMAQLLGFTNIDDNGIEGLELAYQDWLFGEPGKRRVLKDRTGRVIDDLGVIQEPKPGKNLSLSIDRRIQFFAYHALQETLNKTNAKSGSVVVLDTNSQEILALANLPSFNPNARGRYSRDSYRNKAITDTFEPGSVMKPFSIASALETGLYTPNSIIDTNPSWMVVHGHTVRDIHNYGVLDVRGVLQHSSNVGVTKMVLSSPPEQLINLLLRCGVGVRTESGYPGEAEGSIVNVKDANPFVLATLSFGYGVSVTTLQLAKMYSIFANKGKLFPIRLIHYDANEPGVQVIKPEISDQVLEMMEFVVNEGSGVPAKIPGYRVAGKTGTARIAGKNGYSERRYIASFVGIAPVSRPRLVVAVVIHEPSLSAYYAGQVAAPLFAKVMGAALRTLDIEPDKPEETTA